MIFAEILFANAVLSTYDPASYSPNDVKGHCKLRSDSDLNILLHKRKRKELKPLSFLSHFS